MNLDRAVLITCWPVTFPRRKKTRKTCVSLVVEV